MPKKTPSLDRFPKIVLELENPEECSRSKTTRIPSLNPEKVPNSGVRLSKMKKKRKASLNFPDSVLKKSKRHKTKKEKNKNCKKSNYTVQNMACKKDRKLLSCNV